MKKMGLEQVDWNVCIRDAQCERVVITRRGEPVALIIGVEGMDEEQLQMGSSIKFWALIEHRRQQKTVSRTALEKKITVLEHKVKSEKTSKQRRLRTAKETVAV